MSWSIRKSLGLRKYIESPLEYVTIRGITKLKILLFGSMNKCEDNNHGGKKMAVLRCKMCGGDLEVLEGMKAAECLYCGTFRWNNEQC